MKIVHKIDREFRSSFHDEIKKMVINVGARRILDIGGGAKPFFEYNFIEANHINYTILDISVVELQKAPVVYKKICADITGDLNGVSKNYDFCVSYMLAEHVRSAPRLHKNVMHLLRPGGYAVHFFPTLYNVPAIVNLLLPEIITRKVLLFCQPNRTQQSASAKFQAHYKWCFGPSPKQMARFSAIGFHIVEYCGLYGHDYYRRVPHLDKIQMKIAREICRLKMYNFTTAAYVILKKPYDSVTE